MSRSEQESRLGVSRTHVRECVQHDLVFAGVRGSGDQHRRRDARKGVGNRGYGSGVERIGLEITANARSIRATS